MVTIKQIPFWIDQSMKKDLLAFFSSFKTKQEQILQRSMLDKLPNELVIHILSQNVLNLHTLIHALDVSQRIYQLSLHVISHYRLPSLEIAITIDQEGRNRITSKFQFAKMDQESLLITLSCISKTPRRYYFTKASPIIRTIKMTDSYAPCQNLSECMSFQDLNAVVTGGSLESDQSSLISKECKEIKNDTQRNGLLTEKRNKQHHIINHKLSNKNEGITTMHISHQHLFQLVNKSQLQARWRFEYQIKKQECQQYLFLPTNVIIQLDQLLLLQNNLAKYSAY